MTKHLLISLALLLTVFVILTFSQTTAPSITTAEYAEANKLAKRFERRLIQTKDIRPLINEFFVKDFRRRLQRENPPHWSPYLNEHQIAPDQKRKLPQFYETEINWLLLSMLYIDSKPADEPINSDDPFAELPPDVRKVMERKSALYEAMFGDDRSSQAHAINMNERQYFDQSFQLLSETLPMMRKAVREYNFTKWKKLSEKWTPAYKPFTSECDDDCMGYPKTTRLIYVDIPYFQLFLKPERGRLKVVNFVSHID